ncbi:hypothetical protein N7468_008019 [Penicillium chermesinum]|uniref:Polysaccharide export protein n=1 Tax=Penicillium chermesinum TaxID=63820 RepID=A0A9W9NNY8_9EURO|nr:uncharacterized protein N7468_008019 [Penicillium chermesinum]KAJ5223477.1 hypothetical protein N7468_008019 [Penicillium chermesinum]KAJ6155692.1 hypothetical protein N7470_006258 [Penicillium chermesinum]
MPYSIPYYYTIRRALARTRVIRTLLLAFFVFNLLELQWILNRVAEADAVHHNKPRRQERIFIASVNWNNELVLRTSWNHALVDLTTRLGADNVFVSIYESGSYDNTKGALMELDAELQRLQIPRSIILSPVTHEDEINSTPGDGWISTPKGELPRRIPYLSRIRNLSLKPLHDLAEQGITFDKILFLNDVVFTASDVFELLDTNDGEYAAACSMDFSKPPKYYDTFALRDAGGHETVMQTWPYFRSSVSRGAMKYLEPVPVQSCWNGMVAMPAGPFLTIRPLRFRGIPDSLAALHLEGSECCLIHTDNPLSSRKGVYMNPLVRVGYNGDSWGAVNPATNWLSARSILQGLWINRIRRWTSTAWLKEWIVQRRIDEWAALSPSNREPGRICIINEMQVLDVYGWAHV